MKTKSMNFKTVVTNAVVNVQSSMKIVENFINFQYLSSRLTQKELNKSISTSKSRNNKQLSKLILLVLR